MNAGVPASLASMFFLSFFHKVEGINHQSLLLYCEDNKRIENLCLTEEHAAHGGIR